MPDWRNCLEQLREALTNKPDGYVRVKEGPVEPTDLAWSWTSKEWIEVGSVEWTIQPSTDIENFICVIRRGHYG